MSTTTRATVTAEQAEQVLALVAGWMGKHGYGTFVHTDGTVCDDVSCWCDDDSGTEHTVGPAPTGRHAADHGLGPVLNMGWDWPGRPTPTVILEGGPEDWASECSYDVQQAARAAGLPVYVEPYACYALCIYPA